MTFYYKWKFEEARACFAEAVRLNPDSEDSYTRLGRVLNHLGKDDDAEATYRNGLSRIPRSVKLAQYLATSLMWRDHASEAINVLKKATQHSPEVQSLYADLVLAFLLNRDLQSAEEARLVAKSFSPSHDSGVLEMCLELARKNDWSLFHKMVRELLGLRLGFVNIKRMRGKRQS